jgi:hypothetical protein
VQFDTEEHQSAAREAYRTIQIHGAESRVQWARPPLRRPGFRRSIQGPRRAPRAPAADAGAGAGAGSAAGAAQGPPRPRGPGRGRGPRGRRTGGARAAEDSTDKPA